MEKNKTTKDLVATEDLKPILNVLKEEDAQTIIALKEELTDNWTKKQIFRTETEMRISVLNDGKHPTPASKYWQSVREQSAHFDGMMSLSFNLRRNEVKRLKLERKMQKAIDAGDSLKQIEIQIDLDENLYGRANMEQTAKDRVREIATWAKIKAELDVKIAKLANALPKNTVSGDTLTSVRQELINQMQTYATTEALNAVSDITKKLSSDNIESNKSILKSKLFK